MKENARRLAFERAKATALMGAIGMFLVEAESWDCPLLKQRLQEAYDTAQNLCTHYTRELRRIAEKAAEEVV